MHVLGARALAEPERAVDGVEPEEVPVRVVADRRLRAAPAQLAEAVAARRRPGRQAALVGAGAVGREPGDDPVGERPARRVRVLTYQCQLLGPVRRPRPLQRRRDVVAVVGVAVGDQRVVGERRAAQLQLSLGGPRRVALGVEGRVARLVPSVPFGPGARSG
ncbi:hypothetical protein BA062_21285 [Prauserella flavalba]|uniref:Uncharacterized protein n=1 Tax=Prauserella flavalba TaxID=1477506 RepID=A0A318LI48_9PSEU|nr:hypothetical protein BA062_21285 [Prauserella flavalba]